MQTIVIADGLTKEFLGTEQPYASAAVNIGGAEIDRLLGRGRAYGEGPLPAFLAQVSSAVGEDCRLLVLKRDTPLPEILEPALMGAETVASDPDVLPWSELWGAIRGGDEQALIVGAGEPERRFVLVGCHTEGRILSLATFLRVGLGYKDIAVSPAFRHHFPRAGVTVLLDLAEVGAYVGLESKTLAALDCRPPELGPAETNEALPDSQRRVLELLCLNWTRADLRPLAGGFSGSLLLLADGWKGQARTEPAVLKVDNFAQMRRELEGYHRVKEFLGKHVPTFGYPVTDEEVLGVSMELAAMEGSPETLQDCFEEADTDQRLDRFLGRLDKSLQLLSAKLYGNTREVSWVVPYRAFGLHAEKQATWLVGNAELVLSYLDAELPPEGRVDPQQLAKLLRVISVNPDGVDSEVCLVHGDLNFANVICDEIDNIWFIDWTHSDFAPIELDFAKLENDAKFVMSKMFDVDDLARLRQIEEYLLAARIPGDVDSLPESLKFAKWDLRFRKVLETVRRIRQACFALKESEEWLVYRVALLRYATHTLSFDARRDRGECEPQQLMHALYSVESLIYDLVQDDFHLRIRAERPPSYPPRQRISIDEAPWMLDCESYEPPYHVDASVLENDRTKVDGGWADPEAFEDIGDLPRLAEVKYKADDGKPRNPRGRTGIAGRGLLGLWGPNLSVKTLLARKNPDTGSPEVLLGGTEKAVYLDIPKGFVLPDESAEEAVRRVLSQEVGWDAGSAEARLVAEGYTYDARQTDNAWVETRAFLIHSADAPTLFEPGGEFDEVRWRTLEAETVNRLPADQAVLVRGALPILIEAELMDQEAADRLLGSTG
jgi:ADP-ribose pyrophosphatase